MKIALVGGTGSFGRALATRLREAGVEVVVGSRDPERAAEAAAELGSRERERGRRAGVDLAVLAVKAERQLETAEGLAGAIGAKPVLSVGRELAFSKDGVMPTPEARSLAERVADVVRPGRRRGCTRSPRQRSAARRRPTRTRSSAATTRGRSGSRSSSRPGS